MKTKLICSFFLALLYIVINYYYIKVFNFEEDAYIMFRYVEMFVKGYGITFYPGGEHLEGATDFLWLILLSILNKVHIDVGIASIILNAFGVFLITYIMSAVVLNVQDTRTVKILFPFSFLWILFIPIFAALGGFSVFLYSSIILLTVHLLNKEEKINWIPILSIIISLFRPDGVIFGVCFTFIGLYITVKEKRKQYIINMIIALIIGVIYFIWRYTYFKELLPLPLYVKQTCNIWLTFKFNTLGFFSWGSIAGVTLFLICFLLQKPQDKRKVFLLSIPIIIFFSILAFAFQSQNIAFRFQAPIMYIGYYLILNMLINLLRFKLKHKNLLIGLFYLVILLSTISTVRNLGWNYLYNRFTYMNNTFPVRFSEKILQDGDVIAITEAGRLPYWINKKVQIIDLVGLNTKYTAKHKVTKQYIEKVNPDIIMAFINNTYEGTRNVYLIEDPYIFRNSISIGGVEKQDQAMVAVEKFLLSHWNEYDVFFVKFWQSYPHIYAIKKSKKKSKILYNLLNESFNNYTSYFKLKNDLK